MGSMHAMPGVSLNPPIAPPTRASAARPVKWMEYQGLHNWSGLLEPLDDTLRREILRYGEFVEAAYESFDFKPSSTSFGTSRFSADPTIGMAGYRLYHNLVSSSGVRTPSWFECAPGWVRKRSAWIGYIAVSHDREVVSRLGRRDVVVAFRGTATCLEWLENLRASLSPIADPRGAPSGADAPMAASGLLSLYTSRSRWYPSLKDMVRSAMEKILNRFVDEPVSVTVTGHSLGAALALLTAYDISETLPGPPPVTVMSFGGPRVGNRSFRRRLAERGVKVLRIVNSDDIVTRLPGIIVENDAAERSCPAAPWMRKWVEETRWAYADVGEELLLRKNGYSSRIGVLNLPTCHDMSTYLRLLRDSGGSTSANTAPMPKTYATL